MDGDRDDRRNGTAAEDEDQDQRDDDLWHSAQGIGDAAQKTDQAGKGGQTARQEQRQQGGGQRTEQGGDGRDVDRLDQRWQMLPHQPRQVGAVGPGLGQHLAREIVQPRQAFEEIARIAVLRHLKARGHHRDEDDQQQPAIKPTAPDRLHHRMAGRGRIGALARFGTEGDIHHA